MNEKDKWAVAECLGRKIGLDDYTYALASDVVDLLIALGWCPPAPPTDAEIEAAASAMFETRDDPYDDTEWGELTSADRERWECYARAALVAARKVSRHE